MPFTPADNTWSLATIEDSAASPAWATGRRARRATSSIRARSGQLIPTTIASTRDVRRTRRTGSISRRTSASLAAERRRRLPAHAARRSRAGDGPRRLRAELQPGAHRPLHRQRRRQPRRHGRRHAEPTPASRSCCRARAAGALQPAARLGPPRSRTRRSTRSRATTANSVNIFPQDRHLKTPRVHSYSAGFQRSIGRDMAIEVRYVGNQNLYTWAEENWNERSVFENGFFDEFKLAQREHHANIAAGPWRTRFAYTGAPGTSPLPIHLAYLNGRRMPTTPRPTRRPTSRTRRSSIASARCDPQWPARWRRSTRRRSAPTRSRPACRATWS